MLHAKFQDHRTSSSREEAFERFFYHIWASRQYYSWSCDLDHLINFCFLFPRRLHMEFDFDWPSRFRGEDV